MFSAKHLKIGKIGEDAAREFVTELGFKIIGTNLRKPWGEIDIIGKSKTGKVVFFEVKTMRQKNQLKDEEHTLVPEDNMNRSKILKLRKTCQYFANLYPETISEKEGWQIDLITIQLTDDMLLTNSYKNYLIKHYPNISF